MKSSLYFWKIQNILKDAEYYINLKLFLCQNGYVVFQEWTHFLRLPRFLYTFVVFFFLSACHLDQDCAEPQRQSIRGENSLRASQWEIKDVRRNEFSAAWHYHQPSAARRIHHWPNHSYLARALFFSHTHIHCVTVISHFFTHGFLLHSLHTHLHTLTNKDHHSSHLANCNVCAVKWALIFNSVCKWEWRKDWSSNTRTIDTVWAVKLGANYQYLLTFSVYLCYNAW